MVSTTQRDPAGQPALVAADPTFQTYTTSQAQAYNSGRGSYTTTLYSTVLAHHRSTGGTMDLLLDVGCGPGNSTRPLAASFARAIGIDGGAAMINVAREAEAQVADRPAISYECLSAERCDQVTLDGDPQLGKVDLLTSAMAAHWFDMAEFWPRAATLLRPGGTVALWNVASLYAHPATPGYETVQRALFKLERETLRPYMLNATLLAAEGYRGLAMPWDVTSANGGDLGFERESIVFLDWNRNGEVREGEAGFFGQEASTTLDELEASLGTASSVTRWRDAHPELVGTEKDCVRETMAVIRQAMGGEQNIVTGGATSLVMLKKRV